MLEKDFAKLYREFRLDYFQNILENNDDNTLTINDVYCAEVIYLLGRPKISEFAQYLKISQANATYKIRSLIEKGYLQKINSSIDKREFALELTAKYRAEYLDKTFANVFVKAVRANLNDEDLAAFERLLGHVVNDILFKEEKN